MCRFNTCSSCEEQRCQAQYKITTTVFQYMLLLRGATPSRLDCKYARLFQYMLLLRGATEEKRPYYSTIKVSIHAPLARSNRVSHISRIRRVVSIHAPLARSNGSRQLHSERRRCFNTCSSCEEQLSCLRYLCLQPKFQYMLLLRGATRFKVKGHCSLNVSIHAPLARSNFSGVHVRR